VLTGGDGVDENVDGARICQKRKGNRRDGYCRTDYRLERWRSEILGELFTGKGNREKPGLSGGMGPSDLGGLYAPKHGTLRCTVLIRRSCA